MSIRRLLARLGIYDPEARKRDAEVKSRLQEADQSLTEMQRKLREASVKTIRNQRTLTRTMSGISDPGTKRVAGNI